MEAKSVRWTEMTADQQCVLLNAVEESWLFDVLTECGSAPSWPERLEHVPRLAGIIEQMIEQGLIEVTKSSEQPGQPAVTVPTEDVHAIIADPANWWSPQEVRPFGLAATDAGLAVYESTPVRDAEKR